MNVTPCIIVIGFDYSPGGFRALAQGLRIASGRPGSEPHVLLVARAEGEDVYVEKIDMTLSVVSASLMFREDVEAETRKAATSGEARGFARVVTHLRTGDAAEEILRLATALSAAAIVLGGGGRKAAPSPASSGLFDASGARGTPDRVMERVAAGAACALHAGTGTSGEVPTAGLFPEWEVASRIVA